MNPSPATLNPSQIESPDYQRPINPNKVAYYRELVDGVPRYRTYESVAENPPIISLRDDHYWVVDGQHRVNAMVADGVNEYVFLVHTGLTYNEEKKLFLAHWEKKTGGVIPGVHTHNVSVEQW